MAITNLIKSLRGLLGIHQGSGTNQYDVEAQLKQLRQRTVVSPRKPLDAATSSTYHKAFFVARNDIAVTSATFLCETVETTGDASNYATFQLLVGSGTAKAATVAATANTSAANIAVETPFDLTITEANKNLTAGQTLAFNMTKTGAAGETVGEGCLIVTYEER